MKRINDRVISGKDVATSIIMDIGLLALTGLPLYAVPATGYERGRKRAIETIKENRNKTKK